MVIESSSTNSFGHFIVNLEEAHPNPDLGFFLPFKSWGLWYRRNVLIHKNEFIDPQIQESLNIVDIKATF